MKKKRKQKTTYRSKFEQAIANQLTSLGIPFTYESVKIRWTEPAKDRVYTPDYHLTEQNIIIECKGFWKPTDRLKMLEVIRQHPEYDIRIVFMDANKKITRGSQTTYAMWCDKYGIKWAHNEIPNEWLNSSTRSTT